MYVHCHNCGWKQDDFWKVGGYTGLNFSFEYARNIMNNALENYEDRMVEVDKDTFDRLCTSLEVGEYKVRFKESEKIYVDFRDYISYMLTVISKRIRFMKWPTYEEYCNEENKICPTCGSKSLDID